MNTDKIKQYTEEIEKLEERKQYLQEEINQIDKDIDSYKLKIKMEV